MANVYPTNLKINESFKTAFTTPGTPVSISYILNEPASAGVTIHVFSTNSEVRTISLAAGAPGTFRGTNAVIWDGKDNSSSPVALGAYSVAVTAASQGYPGWTQTTDDNTNGNVIYQGRGIAVDQNTNSPYYGRVFIANAGENSQGPPEWLGFHLGIVKCNADGSFADEGGLSTGGYPWAGDTYSPWHLEVNKADQVYVDDFTTNGQVIRWDAAISTNSEQLVLRPDNWANLNVSLSGPAVSGSGTNAVLWMADATFSTTQTGLGILRYALLPDGTCAANDTGTVAVAVGGSLQNNPVDVALDAAGNIYTIQGTDDPADPNNRVFRFPPFNPIINKTPITNADWAIGSTNGTMLGARGIAVDPTGTYLAVAFEDSMGTNGCTQIFFATNGAPITNLDLGIEISGTTLHQDEDCTWDAVGNLYYIDNYYGTWRAVSPPGTNQATTFALSTIQIGNTVPGAPPNITSISLAAGVVTIDFSGGTNDIPNSFTVQSTSSLTGVYTPAPSAAVTLLGPGQFQATVPGSGAVQFYRIER